MSTAKWWVIDGRKDGFAVEERSTGDIVVTNKSSSEEHVLHGYVWKHSPAFGIQIQSEGPPPYGHWSRTRKTELARVGRQGRVRNRRCSPVTVSMSAARTTVASRGNTS